MIEILNNNFTISLLFKKIACIQKKNFILILVHLILGSWIWLWLSSFSKRVQTQTLRRRKDLPHHQATTLGGLRSLFTWQTTQTKFCSPCTLCATLSIVFWQTKRQAPYACGAHSKHILAELGKKVTPSFFHVFP